MIRNVLSFMGLMLLFVFVASAGDDDKKGPRLSFETNGHNFGTIYVDDMPDGKLDIKFSNTGDEPLVLSSVRACCGTRVTHWPRDPILPGEEDTITIEFRLAARPQRISRSVTVTYNNEERPTERYRITGQVVEREEG